VQLQQTTDCPEIADNQWIFSFDEMRIPRQTVAVHIAAAWAEVLDRFPELGARPRGPGRPKKRKWVAGVPSDSDLASDSDVPSD
jgi:hypothetical protein